MAQDGLGQDAQEGVAVVVAVDGGTRVAAVGDAVDGAWEREPERAGHGPAQVVGVSPAANGKPS
jgi:hypothetical protein